MGEGLPGVSIQWPAVSGVGMAAAMDEAVQIDGKLSVGVEHGEAGGGAGGAHEADIGRVSRAERVPRGLLEEGVLPGTVASLLQSVQVCGAGGRALSGCVARTHVVVYAYALSSFASFSSLTLTPLPSQGQAAAPDAPTRARLARGQAQAKTRSTQVRASSRSKPWSGAGRERVKALLDGDTDEDMDLQAPLMEMGLDSLATTQLVRQLGEDLGVPLAPTLLFDYPTVAALSSLSGQLGVHQM